MISGDDLMLLQRGNRGGPNAAIRYSWPAILAWLEGDSSTRLKPRSVREYALGEVEGVPFGFTDATALADGGWLFSAVAEDTEHRRTAPCHEATRAPSRVRDECERLADLGHKAGRRLRHVVGHGGTQRRRVALQA